MDQTTIQPSTESTSPTPPTLSGNSKIKKWIGVLVGLIFVIPIIALIISLYVFQVNNQITQKITQVFPFPVASVNGKWISYADWQTGVATVQHFYNQSSDLGLGASLGALTDEQIESQELDRLVEKELLNQLADQYGIVVSNQEINEEYTTTILPQATSEQEVVGTIEKLYGWSLEEFKEEVVREVVLRSKLQAAMNGDETLNSLAKTSIDQAQADLNQGVDFAETARKYSQDGSAAEGGDLSWIKKGQTVPEFEAVAFSTENGGVSSMFTTTYGYHILKVLEKEDERVHVAHILTKFVTIDEQIATLKASASVKKFLDIPSPDELASGATGRI